MPDNSVLLNAYGCGFMLMARLDAKTGGLSWDASFRSVDGRPGVSFVRDVWPHGSTGEAFGHAALFRR